MKSRKDKCVGFDFGGRCLHAAVCAKGTVRRVVVEPMPEGLIQDGRIASYEAMSDYLKEARRRLKLRGKNAALVLPSALCYCRRSRVPFMTEEQLKFNLPYEFRDYITDNKDDYFYDYAVVETVNGEDGTPKELELMVAAANKQLIRDYSTMFRHAGFHLCAVVPEEFAYINLIRQHQKEAHSHCILDLGQTAIRMYIFRGDRYESVRVLEFGCSALTHAVAEHFNVDIHMAEAYLSENFENATALPVCQEIYNDIAVEVLKAVNFYRFNNREELTHIHCCGGGTRNEALLASLQTALPMPVEDMSEFWPAAGQLAGDTDLVAAAAGAALQ